ncbi:MAG TPA: substrate-binding domain-containing protein [Trebonia sp.]|jgi:L-arabinose transport system substrate-binding protein|nr:substrate-binding domain-containing protein [Trebonia sp.]
MRLRRLPVALAACGLVTAAALSGCSSGSGGSGASAPSHPTFVYLQTDGSQSYFVLEGDGAKAEAAKLGATVKVLNENNSSGTTMSDIQTAISQQANGLIVVAPDATLGPRMSNLAKTGKVAIMASDNGFADSSGQQVPFVGIDASAFGKSTGTILMNYYKQLGWSSASTYMLLYTNPALPTCNQRTTAEQAQVVASGFPASHIVTVPTTDNTTEAAFNNTGPVKTSHPQAKDWLLAGCNDDVAFGGAKALVSSGIPAADVDAVGLGGDLACQVWGKGAPNVGFRGTNYIYPNGIGADAVREMYDNVVKHTPFPANTYVAPIEMSQSNFTTVDKAC